MLLLLLLLMLLFSGTGAGGRRLVKLDDEPETDPEPETLMPVAVVDDAVLLFRLRLLGRWGRKVRWWIW